jgi:hypothetical protein
MAADTLQMQAASFDWAIIASTISILIGGILLGAGLAFRITRLRLLGQEEIAQGIISAAMVGGIFAFYTTLNAVASSAAPPSSLPSCPNSSGAATTPFGYYECNLEALTGTYSNLSSSLLHASVIAGFVSSLKISAGAVSAQPFFALEEASRSLNFQSSFANAVSALAYSEWQLAEIIRTSALAVFLPAGLLLRTFFATRKLGAAAMALSVSAFMVYPLLFLHTFSSSKSLAAASLANQAASSFNEEFASIPLLELDSTAFVKEKIMQMANGDFPGKLHPLLSSSASANLLALQDLAVFPLLSLVVFFASALEFYWIFSAQIFLPYFKSV